MDSKKIGDIYQLENDVGVAGVMKYKMCILTKGKQHI